MNENICNPCNLEKTHIQNIEKVQINWRNRKAGRKWKET